MRSKAWEVIGFKTNPCTISSLNEAASYHGRKDSITTSCQNFRILKSTCCIHL